MSVSNPSISAWANHPVGKAARVVLAVAGLVLATFVLMTASVVDRGSWAMVLLGAVVAAAAARAAQHPSLARLIGLGAAVMAVPASMLLF